MLLKIVIVVFFLLILYALFSAFFLMLKPDREGNDTRMVRRLSWRIGISMVFFLALILAMSQGWIKPHPISPGAVHKEVRAGG